MISLGYIHNGEVKAPFMRAVLDTLVNDRRHLIAGIHEAQSADIVENRNIVVRNFLATNNEWLWFVDSDMSFEPDTLARLLGDGSTSRPIRAAMAFSYVRRDAISPVPVWYDRIERGNYQFIRHFGDGWTQLLGVGMACTLIHRNVFTRLSTIYGDDQFTWFGRDEAVMNGHRVRLGEDLTFCARCARLEIPIWGHAGVRVKHWKTTALGFDQFAAVNKESRSGSN